MTLADVYIPSNNAYKAALHRLYKMGEITLEQYAASVRRLK